MRIVTLIENTLGGEQSPLIAEHGLSLSIEMNGETILFDTGKGGAFVFNVDQLAIDLENIKVAVVSHHHYDHSGGLQAFCLANPHAPIYLRKSSDQLIYSKRKYRKRKYAGLDHKLFSQHPQRFIFLDQFSEISPNVFIIVDIKKTHKLPHGNHNLYVQRGNRLIHDPFDHELLMVVREDNGLVILSGCSHHGVLNMLDTVLDKFPGEPIKALIGGFHLTGYPKLDLTLKRKREARNIVQGLLKHPIGTIYSGYCTSQQSYDILHELLGNKLHRLATGRDFIV